ncbi:MAG: hypothetical protein AAB914_01725 [Patescibacteria group bacterium]
MTNPEITKKPEFKEGPMVSGQTDPSLDIRVKFEEGRFIYADVPLHLIEKPNIPIDHEHVEELAEKMLSYKKDHDVEGGNGQEDDVMLAQLDDDPNKLHITEGLHRINSLTLNGEGYVRAKILTHSSMQEVTEKRMSGVKEHQSIRTSRAVTIIDELWQFTPWKDKLTSAQAFALTNDDRSGKDLGISSEEAEEIKQWAKAGAEECNLSVTTIDKHLRLIDAVDLEIIKNSREMHGKKDSPYFASANLKWLAKHLRGEFDKQKLVVEAAIEKNLSSSQVEKLAMQIAGFEDINEAQVHIEKTVSSRSSNTKPRRQTNIINAETNGHLPDTLMTSELDFCRLAIEHVIATGRYTPLLVKTEAQPIVFKPTNMPEQALPFDWSRDQRERLSSLIGGSIGLAVGIGTKQFRIPDDKARQLATTTRERILGDVENGVLKYTGIQTKEMFIKIFSNCYRDEVKLYKNSISHRGKNPVSITNTKKRLVLDEKSFRNLITGIEDMTESRMLTLSTVFGLPSMAIAQILELDNPITVRGQLVKLSERARLITSK